MVIEIRFVCGHGVQAVDIDRVPQPVCLECGATRIVDTNAPPPRITGCATGPLVRPQALPAIPIAVGTGKEH